MTPEQRTAALLTIIEEMANELEKIARILKSAVREFREMEESK